MSANAAIIISDRYFRVMILPNHNQKVCSRQITIRSNNVHNVITKFGKAKNASYFIVMVNDTGTFHSKLGLVGIKGELSLCSDYSHVHVYVNHLQPVKTTIYHFFYLSAMQISMQNHP